VIEDEWPELVRKLSPEGYALMPKSEYYMMLWPLLLALPAASCQLRPQHEPGAADNPYHRSHVLSCPSIFPSAASTECPES